MRAGTPQSLGSFELNFVLRVRNQGARLVFLIGGLLARDDRLGGDLVGLGRSRCAVLEVYF